MAAPVGALMDGAGPAHRPYTVLAMSRQAHSALCAEQAFDRLREVARVDTALLFDEGAPDPADQADPAVTAALARAEVLFTHWGCPPLTEERLRHMPRLRAVVHAAGSVKHHITEAVWQRGITVSSAAAANALPVAEYTLAAILFANKRVLQAAQLYRAGRAEPQLLPFYAGHGNHGRTVGIVGASRTGRRVIELLRPFDLQVIVQDPFLTREDAQELGVKAVALDELVRRSHVVSIHAPQLPETWRMFDRRRLALLRDGATLINTARGSLIDTAALTAELVSGRIHAVLDVTDPEVLPADSPLYDLPNVLLTPHIAGSLGGELGRMAHEAAEELGRYAQGLAFEYAVVREDLGRSA